jgi:hypothetical protein
VLSTSYPLNNNFSCNGNISIGIWTNVVMGHYAGAATAYLTINSGTPNKSAGHMSLYETQQLNAR